LKLKFLDLVLYKNSSTQSFEVNQVKARSTPVDKHPCKLMCRQLLGAQRFFRIWSSVMVRDVVWGVTGEQQRDSCVARAKDLAKSPGCWHT
jgi:hypothetical protein